MTSCMGVVAMARSNVALYKCLCPWFLRDGTKNIDCEACKGFGKEIRIIFDSEEEKKAFQKEFCFDRHTGLDDFTTKYKKCPYAELAEYMWNKS